MEPVVGAATGLTPYHLHPHHPQPKVPEAGLVWVGLGAGGGGGGYLGHHPRYSITLC